MTRLDRRALVAALVTAGLVVVMVALSAGREPVFDTVLYALLALTLATVGTLVASRRAENPIGWLFCGLALWTAIAEVGEGYGYNADAWGLPGGSLGEWVITWSWTADAVAWTMLVLLFPDGRLLSGRWRAAIWAALAGFFLLFVGQGLNEDTADLFSGGENPFAINSPLVELAFAAGMGLILGALIAAVISAVIRFRRSAGVERQQLKWFAYAGMTLALVMPVAGALWYRSALVQVVTGLALNAMPLAVGAAILRYRLYDIDVLINRTLVYGALTATLAASYLGLVLLLQVVLSPLTESSNLAIAGSTLAVAALFRPARRRIQELVDRRFYRRRYDAARTLERFGGRLRDEVDLDTLGAELRTVISETVQPAHVSLWLRSS